MELKEMLDASKARNASFAGQRRVARPSVNQEFVVTRIIGAADANTKNGKLPRFGVVLQGVDQPIYGFKSAVRGNLPDYVPASGIKADITISFNDGFMNISSLAFKFVDDAKYHELQAKVAVLKGTGIAVQL